MKEESQLLRSWPTAIVQHASSLWQRIRQTELTILMAVALVVGGAWLFVELAEVETTV